MSRFHRAATFGLSMAGSFVAATAFAQTTTTPTTIGLNVGWGSGTKHLDCYSGTNCQPINVANCAAANNSTTSWPISAVAQVNSATTVAANSTAYAWIEKSGSNCKWTDKPANAKNVALTVGGPLVDRQKGLTFPGDFAVTFSTADFLAIAKTLDAADDYCANPVDNREFYLCFAVDVAPLNTIDDLDPIGKILIPIDTKNPTAPGTPTATASDALINVTASVQSGIAKETVAAFKVYYREVEDGRDEDLCTLWEAGTFTEVSASTATGSAEVALEGLTNGTTYEMCALAVDALGNVSDATALVTASPADECDFLECYPGGLKTGYCGAQAASTFGLLLVGLATASRLRRRKLPHRAS